jgi:hypothetical protein
MMNVCRDYIQDWERDRRTPDQEDWQKLVEILGLDARFKPSGPTAE